MADRLGDRLLASDGIIRLFLALVAAVLGAGAGFVWYRYGLGIGAAVLSVLFALAMWGTLSQSSRTRDNVAGLFSSWPF